MRRTDPHPAKANARPFRFLRKGRFLRGRGLWRAAGAQSGTAAAVAVRAAASAHNERFPSPTLRAATVPPAWRSYFPARRADYGKKEKGTIHD